MNSTGSKRRIIFIDALRIIACFLVILYHARYNIYDYVANGGRISYFEHFILNISFLVGRFAVPIFFILSGYFAFKNDCMVFPFLRKRFERLGLPLLFWATIYTLTFSNSQNFLYDLLTIKQAPHLWYIYALLGMTVLIPVISNFIMNCKRNELLFYIFLGGVTMIFNGNFFDSFSLIHTNHQGMLFTNPISALLNLSGFITYFFIGAFIRIFSLKKVVPYFLLCFSILIMALIYFYMDIDISGLIAYNSIFTAMIAVAFILITQQVCDCVNLSESRIIQIRALGEMTFGIYLVHYLIMRYLYLFNITVWENCLITSIITMLISFILIKFIKHIPYSKYIIG